ncbi:MAG: 3-oxoacyl-ACP synthase [Oligoflexales bacterium]|nr:3-oxoacyl-ACP synthase [Oligoflexales bacterium]
MNQQVSLIGTASYLPSRVVDNSYFNLDPKAAENLMFKGCLKRHHASPEETAPSMIKKAATTLSTRLDFNLSRDVDILIINTHFLDRAFTGCGAQVAHELNLKTDQIIDMHNGGCISFVMMMHLAAELMQSGSYQTALICNVQNGAGRIFSQGINRQRPQSAIPGDGCGVGLLVKSDLAPILSFVRCSFGEHAYDMNLICEHGTSKGWWEPHVEPFNIEFNADNIAKIIERGNTLVPMVGYEALKKASVDKSDIDYMICNQPNPLFLEHWRKAFGLPSWRLIHTFFEHGNLFGAGPPIAYERGCLDGRIKKGNKILMAGFSHAGDYAAAAVITAA